MSSATHASKRTGTRQRGPVRNDAGVALILALLFVVLLTVIVVEFTYETQVEASFATNQGADLEAYLAAKSAVARGISMLAEDLLDVELNNGFEVDSTLDVVPWSFGVPFEQLNEAVMRTSISDEYSKLNLNAMFRSDGSGNVEENEYLVEGLRRFFLYRDESIEDPVDAILDWLDYDDNDETRPEGAEDDYYSGLEIPYACKNGPMDSLEELLLIKGITPEIYYGDPEKEQLPLSEFLTVHGDWDGRVNVNMAPLEVLEAVFEGRADQVQSSPQESAMEIYEEVRRNQPFTEASQVEQYAPSAQDEARDRPRRQRQASLAPQMFTVGSNVFRIYGDGMMEDTMVRIEAYVWRRPLGVSDTSGLAAQAASVEEPFRILDWKVIR